MTDTRLLKTVFYLSRDISNRKTKAKVRNEDLKLWKILDRIMREDLLRTIDLLGEGHKKDALESILSISASLKHFVGEDVNEISYLLMELAVAIANSDE